MSRVARAAGIKPGMCRGGVLMLAPDARIYERSSTSEDQALQAVALALLQYSPPVALAEESSLVVDWRLVATIRRHTRAVPAGDGGYAQARLLSAFQLRPDSRWRVDAGQMWR